MTTIVVIAAVMTTLIGLLSLPAQASSTLMQTNTCAAGAVTSLACAYSSNTAKSNLLVVGAVSDGNTTLSISDSQGNTWTQANTIAYNFATKHLYLWFLANCPGGADTVTITLSASADVAIAIREYNGLATSSPLDQTAAAAGPDGTPQASADSGATATTTAANELLIGAAGNLNSTISAGTGYGNLIQVNQGTSIGLGLEDRTVSSTGAYHATFGFSPNDQWGCIVATFKWMLPNQRLTSLGVGD
jgi:hypothetical protein